MDTSLSKEDKVFIIESKIKAFNEYIYNYSIDLSLELSDPQASEKSEHYDSIRINLETAEAKKIALQSMLDEVLAS
jgi:hypothetical protein